MEYYQYLGILYNMQVLLGDLSGFVFPQLVYSGTKPPRKKIGYLSRDEIKDELFTLRGRYREKYPNQEQIINILTGPGAKWAQFEFKPSLERKIPEWTNGLKDKIKEILAGEEATIVTDGLYNSAANQITIFSKAFDKYSEADRFYAVRRAIAHEVFHAYHCHVAPATYHEDSYYAEVVREALADFYSVILCLDLEALIDDETFDFRKSEEIAQKREDFWRDCLYMDTPYPNAAFFMYKDGHIQFVRFGESLGSSGEIDKFKTVLEESKSDMLKAYNTLVPEEFRKNPDGSFLDRPEVPIVNPYGNLIHFEISHVSGAVYEDMPTHIFEADRRNKTFEWYLYNVSEGVHDEVSFMASCAPIEQFFTLLERAEWEPLYGGFTSGGDSWNARLTFDSGKVLECRGGMEHPDGLLPAENCLYESMLRHRKGTWREDRYRSSIFDEWEADYRSRGGQFTVRPEFCEDDEKAVARVRFLDGLYGNGFQYYSYICDFDGYNVIERGDKVVVPVGKNNEEKEAVVEELFIQKPSQMRFPYERMKTVIRKG